MNGPRSTGPEYTGKHRRDSGPGALPPGWGGRSESPGRPIADSRPVSGAAPLLGSGAASAPGFRPEPGPRAHAG
jgi:hypothetical protein